MRSPIILESNLIPGNYGALPPNQYYSSPTAEPLEGATQNEDGTYTAPTYQLQSNKPTFDLDEMQNIYGTKYMPMFRWVSQQQTGNVTFDPRDDTIDEDEANRMRREFEDEYGMDPAEVIKRETIGAGVQIAKGIGGQIGRSVAHGMKAGESFSLDKLGDGITEFKDNFSFDKYGGDVFSAPEAGPSANVDFSKGTPNAEYVKYKANNPEATLADKKGVKESLNKGLEADGTKPKVTDVARPVGSVGGLDGYFSGVGDRTSSFGPNSSAAGRANLYGSAGAGAATAAAMLVSGASLKESAKAGVKVSAGTYIGTAIGGPIGGFIGGMLGGRVICNELQRQGIMTRKQVVLDYKFTRDYLTPTHVNGYHIWAVWMVKQMRKGRLVNFWTHVAGHRANEIAYIYGESAKPDYLGKVYRKILEPICWSIGFFCKKTDWSVLYKQKEV